jgi:hypothetical protein|tara:strand:+ start:337 stop:558 length:222 start_codon:yes stop_codon:yes gene_type:complete
MGVFKRSREYTGAVLKEGRPGRWVSNKPLFTCGDKGLFPVFKTGGPTGRFPVNHQEFILKNINGKENNLEDRI